MPTQLAHKLLLEQRSRGALDTRLGQHGLVRHREDGCLKLRLPHGAHEAIMINTSGGLAGGDQLTAKIAVEPGSAFVVTSQAAERAYKTLGPAAEIEHQFEVAEGASLAWVPQETIMFDAASLKRKMTVRLSPTATFLGVESIVLGRIDMGEKLSAINLHDHWDIWQGGKLIHAERLSIVGALPRSLATLGENSAFATMLLVSDQVEFLLPQLCKILSGENAVSAWNGKLIARLVAKDGFQLRKTLKKVLSACLLGKALPRLWEM